jgi:hypothetical protein
MRTLIKNNALSIGVVVLDLHCLSYPSSTPTFFLCSRFVMAAAVHANIDGFIDARRSRGNER